MVERKPSGTAVWVAPHRHASMIFANWQPVPRELRRDTRGRKLGPAQKAHFWAKFLHSLQNPIQSPEPLLYIAGCGHQPTFQTGPIRGQRGERCKKPRRRPGRLGPARVDSLQSPDWRQFSPDRQS